MFKTILWFYIKFVIWVSRLTVCGSGCTHTQKAVDPSSPVFHALPLPERKQFVGRQHAMKGRLSEQKNSCLVPFVRFSCSPREPAEPARCVTNTHYHTTKSTYTRHLQIPNNERFKGVDGWNSTDKYVQTILWKENICHKGSSFTVGLFWKRISSVWHWRYSRSNDTIRFLWKPSYATHGRRQTDDIASSSLLRLHQPFWVGYLSCVESCLRLFARQAAAVCRRAQKVKDRRRWRFQQNTIIQPSQAYGRHRWTGSRTVNFYAISGSWVKKKKSAKQNIINKVREGGRVFAAFQKLY